MLLFINAVAVGNRSPTNTRSFTADNARPCPGSVDELLKRNIVNGRRRPWDLLKTREQCTARRSWPKNRNNKNYLFAVSVRSPRPIISVFIGVPSTRAQRLFFFVFFFLYFFRASCLYTHVDTRGGSNPIRIIIPTAKPYRHNDSDEN